MNHTYTPSAGQPERTRLRLVGACITCGETNPTLRGGVLVPPHAPPGMGVWLCRGCLVLAAISQAQRDRIDSALVKRLMQAEVQ